MDHSLEAVAVFDKRANEYEAKYMDVSLYHDSLDVFCGNIRKGEASVLEIGCGPGNVTKYLLNKRPELKITGIDASSRMISLAEKNNPTAEFQVKDCRNIGSVIKKYDAIMCGFCLPYLSKNEAISLISDASALLMSGGVVYLSTMEDDYQNSGWQRSSAGDEMYIHYHEEGYLLQALTDNNFRIIDIRHQDYPTQSNDKTTDLIIIAMK